MQGAAIKMLATLTNFPLIRRKMDCLLSKMKFFPEYKYNASQNLNNRVHCEILDK